VLGTNYFPRNSGPYMWKDDFFSIEEISNDFRLCKMELGFDVIRIFLIWEDFMPTASAVSESAVEKLVQVANAADKWSLKLDITFFVGHMYVQSYNYFYLFTYFFLGVVRISCPSGFCLAIVGVLVLVLLRLLWCQMARPNQI
jgi:hypothetical protein